MKARPDSQSNPLTIMYSKAVIPVWRVLFDACEFDADQFDASHFDAMPVWRETVWRVFQFDAWQFGAFFQVWRVVHFSRFLYMLTHSALHREMNNVEM